ncbi:MAG: peptidase caspase catalytic subunit p20 [Ramlibacter sp.]|nr:peptidase caspase catalytic subunit p20 [Ramlibacter sp.]
MNRRLRCPRAGKLMRGLLCFFILAIVSVSSSWSQGTKRVALLIGNSSYAIGGLTFPHRDVQEIDLALRAVGFEPPVIVLDGDQRRMKRAIQEFGVRAQGADIAIFYYSGHGAQSRGENYLLPVDSNVVREADYDLDGVAVDAVLRQISIASPRAAIVILDACRDNPVATFKSGTKGLARMEAPAGTMIAFATAPNTTTPDNGLYARVLAFHLRRTDVELLDVFRDAAAEVMKTTGNSQIPRVGEVTITDRIFLASTSSPSNARHEPTPSRVAGLQVAASASRPGRVAEDGNQERSTVQAIAPSQHEARLRSVPVTVTLANVSARKNEFVASIAMRSDETNSDLGVALLPNDQGGWACASFNLTDGQGGICPACWGGSLTSNSAISSLKLWRQGGPDPYLTIPPGGAVQHVIYFHKARCLSPIREKGNLSVNGEFVIRRADGSPVRAAVSFSDVRPTAE